jgi:hypothetical protein
MGRRIWGLALAAILTTATVPAFSADVPDEQYLFTFKTVFPNLKAPDNWFGVWFSDKPNYPSVPVLTGTNTLGKSVTCSSIDETNCKNINDFTYVANYPFCSTNTLTDCIDEVFAVNQSGQKISSTNMEYLPKNPVLLNAKSYFHPGGASKEIFDLPGVKHKGGSTKYAIEVMMQGNFKIADRTNPSSGYSSGDSSFYVNITPVDMKSGTYDLVTADGNSFSQPAKFDRNCVVLDIDRCGMAQGFPSGYKFGASIRMATRIYGWLQGRVQDAEFQSQDVPGGKKITVTGYPMTVPSIAGGGDYQSKLNTTLQQTYKSFYDKKQTPVFDNYTADRGTAALKAFSDWAPVLGDKATVMPTVWSFRNIKKDEFVVAGLQAGRCIVSAMKTGIGGMVSTNATVYSSGPPVFNETTQSLDYKVAAPHFTSKGDVFRGYYNLKITAETARCIYNFKPIPMQATISVVSDAGEKVVGTTIVKSDDEWVELTAANFEFSSPTLRVKFSENISKVEVATAPSPTPILVPSTVAKKSTIVCVKGKLTKKISGVNPKCPAGYKKKN